MQTRTQILFSLGLLAGCVLISTPTLAQTTPSLIEIDANLGERFESDGVVFIIKEAILGEWIGMGHAQSLSLFSSHNQPPAPILAVRYDFINENLQRKFDLSKPFGFTMRDEFGNVYRFLEKPLNYHQTTDSLNGSFPSVYPGERIGQTIFFEGPIKSAKELYLHINAKNIGLVKDIIVKIPSEGIVRLDEKFYERLETAKKQDEELRNQIGPIRIVKPKNGITVEPGQQIRIEVEVPERSREPDNVFVMIPSYVLKDPDRHYSYELTVPKTGEDDRLTVLVIGQWLDGDREEILSDSIVLKIFNTSAL